MRISWLALAMSCADGGGGGGTGGGLAEGECRSVADCPDDPDCIEPDWSAGCGMNSSTYSPPCTVEGEPCAGGQVCEGTIGSCGGQHFACVDPCTGDDACGADERCRPSGACTPASCAEGEFTCAADEVCGAGDLHGCGHPTCDDDPDCGDGQFCVSDRCFATPGSCGEKLYPP